MAYLINDVYQEPGAIIDKIGSDIKGHYRGDMPFLTAREFSGMKAFISFVQKELWPAFGRYWVACPGGSGIGP